MPARRGDIPNAYVKADEEEHLDIYLAIPQGIKIKNGTLRQYGVQDKSYLALQLKKSLYGLKQAGFFVCGENCYTPGWRRQDSRSVKLICACTISTRETM